MKRPIYQRLLTRPIYNFERSRRYPVRGKVYELPPLATDPASSLTVLILTAPATFDDAGWAAYSMLRYLPPQTGLCLVVDGTAPEDSVARMRRLFPGVVLANSKDFAQAISKYPALYEYAGHHPMGRKLAAILTRQLQGDILYSDADVLAFNPMPELVEAISTGTPCYLTEEFGLNPDNKLLDKIKRMGVNYAQDLNAGFVFVPRGALNIALAEELLSADGYDRQSWFSEQTTVSALMGEANARPLPKPKYVLSNQRQFFFQPDVNYDEIALRHFTSPTRHLMYSRGIPHVRKNAVAK